MQASTRGVLLAIVSAASFGTLAIFGRLATLAGMELPALLAFRFLLATPFIWIPLSLTGRLELLRGRDLVIAVGLGAVGYASMSFLFLTGVNLTGAGLGAIILYIYPAIVVVLAAVFLDEPITRVTILAVAVSLAGVVLVTMGQPMQIDPRGVGIVLLGAIVYAGYITLSRTLLTRIDASVLTAHVVPAASLTFLLHGAMTGSMAIPATTEQWWIVLGIAVLATAIPIVSFFAAVAIIGAGRTSIVSTFEPVATVVLGALLLGETITPTSIAGGVAVLTGVVLVQWERTGETGDEAASSKR